MRITERAFGDVTVLDLEGRLNGPEATEVLGTAVRRLVGEGRPHVVANLEHVTAVDAAGLGAMVDAYCVLKRANGNLKLAHVTGRLQDLLVITRLVTVLDTFDSVDNAIRDGWDRLTPSKPQLSQTSLGVIQRFLRQA